MTELEPKKVVERYQRAKESRGTWESHYQFSCWNLGDPNREKILMIDPADRVFQVCVRIARRAVAGVLADPTNGATHYHAKRARPLWSVGREPSAIIGNHKFYSDVE
ncbi:MAG: cell wall hydrolase [Rhodospirillales bacterium]|jgi:N-acetylmuramoyl-L-alanine amidase|nr:cell wall hydrolase [Rhodospirillales bacterium]